MHSPTLLSLALATLATSHPLSERAPEFSSARAFRLVANQTSSSEPLVHGLVMSTVQLNQATALVVLTTPNAPTDGSLFYLNGTAEQWDVKQLHVLTDRDSPLAPWGLNVSDVEANPAAERPLSMIRGSGQNMVLARSPAPIPRLDNPKGAGVWVACRRYVSPVVDYMPVVGYVYGRKAIPEECSVIELLPECAELNELPEGSESSHDNALVVKCYPDVTAIDWSQ